MTPQFQVGEIAIVARAKSCPQYIGSECTVIGGLMERAIWFTGRVTCYVVQMADGQIWAAPPETLRKRFEPGSWGQLRDVWQPIKREQSPS